MHGNGTATLGLGQCRHSHSHPHWTSYAELCRMVGTTPPVQQLCHHNSQEHRGTVWGSPVVLP